MEYKLTPIEHKIFFKDKEYKFESPILWDLEIITKKLSSWDIFQIMSVIDLFLWKDKIKQTDKFIHYSDILTSIYKEINPDYDKWWQGGLIFYPANIVFFAEKYGMHPTDFMKKTTLNQLLTYWAWTEWNMNIQNGKPERNQEIINRQVPKELIEEAK